ncbi:MAG: phenolic acid decarboxylase [Candidatus Sulfotelmatobacter sp.]
MSRDVTSSEQLQGLVGKRFFYIYDNGWRYELYVKNVHTIDYRIHSGRVGGRWVKNQRVSAVWLGNCIYKISWDEPTGTSVSIAINLESRRVHGVIFFPKWVADDPKKTVCFQNQHYDEMLQYRDAGPTYPRHVVDEFAQILLAQDVGTDREDIIDCSPDQLPPKFLERLCPDDPIH